jgi:hypothetical protein
MRKQESSHIAPLLLLISAIAFFFIATVDGKPYSEIVHIARNYIKDLGGFEKLAEWGIV